MKQDYLPINMPHGRIMRSFNFFTLIVHPMENMMIVTQATRINPRVRLYKIQTSTDLYIPATLCFFT